MDLWDIQLVLENWRIDHWGEKHINELLEDKNGKIRDRPQGIYLDLDQTLG